MEKERVLIGRTNHCDLRIPLSSVSRKHCELRLSENRLLIRDLDSSNGTFHNSNRVKEAALAAGDEIVIGPVVFTVVIDGEPARIDPVKTLLPRKKGGDNLSQDSSLGLADPHDATLPGEPHDEADTSTTADLEDPISTLEAMAKAEHDNASDDVTSAGTDS